MAAFIIILITIANKILKLHFLLGAYHDRGGQTHLGHIIWVHHESDMGPCYIPLLPINQTHRCWFSQHSSHLQQSQVAVL